MAVELSDGFSLRAKTFNFERDNFKTVSAMTSADLNNYPDAFLATCQENHQVYILNEPNGTWDPVGGSGNSASNVSANTNAESGDVLSSITINDKSYLIKDKVGELSALTVSAQSCAVSAINEVIRIILEDERIHASAMDELEMRMGDPSDLETEEKYCIVDAINELYEIGVGSGGTVSGGTKVSANTNVEEGETLSSLTIDNKNYLIKNENVNLSKANGNILSALTDGLYASAETVSYSGSNTIDISSANTVSVKTSSGITNAISALTDGLYTKAVQVKELPNASGTELNTIYQYVGDTNDKYTQAYFYKSEYVIASGTTDTPITGETLYASDYTTRLNLIAITPPNGLQAADDVLYEVSWTGTGKTDFVIINKSDLRKVSFTSSYYVLTDGSKVYRNSGASMYIYQYYWDKTWAQVDVQPTNETEGNYVEKVTELPATSARTEGTIVNLLTDGKLYVLKKDTVTMVLNGNKYHFDNSIDDAYYYTNGSQRLYTDGDWDDYLTYDSAHTQYCSAIDDGNYYDWYCYESDNDILYVFNDDNFDEPNTEVDYINIYNEYSLNFQTNITQSEQNEYDDSTRTDTMVEVNLGDRVNPDWHTFKKGPIYLLTYLMGEKNSDNYGKLYWEEVVNDEIYTVSQSIKTCETPIYPTTDFEIGDKYIDTVDNHGTHVYTKINEINQVKVIKGYSATTDNIISTNNQGEMYWNDLVEITLTPASTGIVQSYLLELPMNWHGTGYLLDSSNSTPLTFTFACGSAEVVSVANPTTTFPARLFQGFGTNVNKFILTFYLNHSIKLCVSGYKPTDVANIYSLTASGVPSNPTLSFRPINGVTYNFACATSNLSAISTLTGYTLDNKCYYSKQITATSGVFTPTLKDWCENSVLFGNYTTAAMSINVTNYPSTINKHTRFNLANQTTANATLKIYKNVDSYKYYLLGYLSSYTEYVISFPTGCFLDLTFGFTNTLYSNSNTKAFVRDESIGVINSNLFGPYRLGSIEAAANS